MTNVYTVSLSQATVTTGQRRIGDRVRMDNIEMATQWQALFDRQCIPLHDDEYV